MKKASQEPDCTPEAKAYIEQWVKQGVPPAGENFELSLPQVLSNQMMHMRQMLAKGLEEYAKDKSESEMEAFMREQVPEIVAGVYRRMADKYYTARDEVEAEVDTMKAFFRSQKDVPGKTKADVLKEIWAELPKHTGQAVPPLDDEMLAELAEEPPPKRARSGTAGARPMCST